MAIYHLNLCQSFIFLMNKINAHVPMDPCDWDELGHELMLQNKNLSRREGRGDMTFHNYAMRPPRRNTKHAQRRLKERQGMSLQPVYAPSTRQSVVVTYLCKPKRLKLAISSGAFIGKGGQRVKQFEQQSGASMHVKHGYVIIRGKQLQVNRACNLIKSLVQ